MMYLTVALASLALTLAPTPVQEDSTPAQAWWDSFPAASADLTLTVEKNGNGQSLMALVNDYAALTGQHLVIPRMTRTLLEASTTGIQAPIAVPRSEVQSFFESILIQHDFVMLLVRAESPRLLTLLSLRTTDRNTVRSHARFVPREHIGKMRDHPAMLVTTSVTLPYVDVVELSSSMRALITDAATQQILPAGNTDSLLITGFGPATADLVVMFERVNADAQETWEREQERRQLEQATRKAGAGDSSGD